MRNAMKGQFTILTLIGVFITLIIFALLYPTINTYIVQLQPQLDPLTAQMIGFLPFFIVLGIILTAIFYGLPFGQQR